MAAKLLVMRWYRLPMLLGLLAALLAILPLVIGLWRGHEPFGQQWFALHAPSLQVLQPAVQRYLHPAIWDFGIQPVLETPGWVVACLPALILALVTGVSLLRRRGRPDGPAPAPDG